MQIGLSGATNSADTFPISGETDILKDRLLIGCNVFISEGNDKGF